MTSVRLVAAFALGLLAAGSACIDNPEAPQALDEAFFRCRVEPVLVADCGFYACHGDPARPYRVYAPNRLRLGVPEAQRALVLTPEEHEANFRAALAFAQPVAGYPEPLLVSKPLADEAGGAYHAGEELAAYGDVFTSREDPDRMVIEAWIRGSTEDPTCGP